MKKRLISFALSAITAISAVSAMSASAVVSSIFNEEVLADCIKLENHEWLSDNFFVPYGELQGIYYKYHNDNSFSLYNVTSAPDYFSFSISQEEAPDALVKIKEIDENLIIPDGYKTASGNISFSIYPQTGKIGIETVKKIRNAIGETTQEFKYYPDCLVYNTGVICANQYKYYNNPLVKEKLSEYIESNNIEAELIELNPEGDFDEFEIVFANEITPVEQLEFAKKIYEATDLIPAGGSTTGLNSYEITPIDFTDYLNGDANCDNAATMADAAAILQAIGNPDKYALSDLGEFNADYAGDGLTADDAIAIQKKLAGIE